MAKKKAMLPKPPAHLATATKKWWASIVEEYQLESHHLRILTLAAESWDRCLAAREIIDVEGLTYTDRFGAPRARPEVAIERDGRLAFARLVRELGLDASEPAEPSRPPRIGGK
jgi:P27 family predicted phage terminase small subunit